MAVFGFSTSSKASIQSVWRGHLILRKPSCTRDSRMDAAAMRTSTADCGESSAIDRVVDCCRSTLQLRSAS